MQVPVEVWLATFVATAIVLFYSLAGYAMLCALAAMLPRRSSGTAPLPRVSVIIPAHNEAVILRAKLENALAIDYPRELLEILVASDGSVDATVEIAREFEDRGVRVLELEPRRGKASVLNDAVAASQGDVLCLCDANVM